MITPNQVAREYLKHLFSKVYSIDNGDQYEFYHLCGPTSPEWDLCYLIHNRTGRCIRCKEYIASYKKLQVMVSLKDLLS